MNQQEAVPGARVTWAYGIDGEYDVDDAPPPHGTIQNPFSHPHLTMLPEFALVKWDDDPEVVCVTAVKSLRPLGDEDQS